MPDITLPNGKIIKNVPAGATKAQVMRKAIAGGFATESDFPQPEPPAAPEVPDYQRAGQTAAGAVESVANVASELMAAVNRGAINLADLPANVANWALEQSGSDTRAATLAGNELVQQGTRGNFMEEGLPRDVVRAAGEVAPAAVVGGAALSQAATKLPASFAGNTSRAAAASQGARTAAAPVMAPAESTTAGVVRQLGASAPAADATYGAASGAGAEVGREYGGETGATFGAFAAPLSLATFKSVLGGVFNMGRSALESATRSVDELGEDGMAKLLAEAMEREGMTPDQVVKRMGELGPEVVPADVGTGFARLLRLASNKVPRLEGEVHSVLDPRHAAQGDRITAAFDRAGVLPNASVDDVIVRLDEVMKPKINALYGQVRSKPFAPSERLRALLEGDNAVGQARKSADARLKNKRAAGDEITHIDVIDATKQELDDQISRALRDGEKNTARDLIRLKNIMVDEADKAIPEYKQARNLFAGKAGLESAADLGQQFFKMKSRDVVDAVKSMGKSEQLMFRMGAKQALMDKLDGMQISRDAVKALFGKGGDARKLQAVFPDRESFNQFAETLEREAYFVMTRRAAQANSTTFKQLSDGQSFQEAMEGAAAITGDPAAATNLVVRTLSRLTGDRSSAAFTKALEEVGDVLLERGMNPDKIASILRRGSAKEVSGALRRVLPKVPGSAFRAAVEGTAVESAPRTSDKWGLTIAGDAG